MNFNPKSKIQNLKSIMALAMALLVFAVPDARAATASGSATAPADTRDYTLTVASAHGNPVPGVGIHTYAWCAAVTASVDAVAGGYIGTGWIGTGSIPATGVTPTTGEIVLSAVASSITWQWISDGTLGEAVDASRLTWNTGGDVDWFKQTATTHDGVDAAQSGAITHNQQSWMQTTVTGPDELSFWWKVSSETSYDLLRFYIDDVEQPGAISGLVDWQQKFYSIPSGNHTLKWVYSKDGSVSSEQNCGWVDQVVLTSDVVPVHRFWSDQFGSHFYIMGDSERDRIAAKYPGVWNYEAAAWYAYPTQVEGTEPVHRFWSDRLGKHFYIMGDSERDRIAAKYKGIWNYEAVAWYAYPTQVAGAEPVGRFWSDQFMGHFYIITQPEITRITAKYPGIWNYEAVAYYAFTSPPDGRENKSFASVAQMDSNEGASEKIQDDRKMAIDTTSMVLDDGLLKFDVVYPLAYPNCHVAAQVYDSVTEQWKSVLAITNSSGTAVLESVQPDRSYFVEVFASNAEGCELESVHRSWFSSQLDVPDTFDEEDSATAPAGIGMPTVRLTTPAVDGTMTVKLYSSKLGVVQTLSEVSSGDIVELALPEWNGWYWISGSRDTDNALVLSIWLRPETEE